MKSSPIGRWTWPTASPSPAPGPSRERQPGGLLGCLGLPGLRSLGSASRRQGGAMSSPAPSLQSPPPLAPRVRLGDVARVAPALHTERLAKPQPPATVDVEALKFSAERGKLAQSALQLALDRPGQTIEFALAVNRSGLWAADGGPPDRTLRLRYEPGAGVALSTSAPMAGARSFPVDPSAPGKDADTIAGLLDRVGSLGKFTVMRVSVDPPPVSTGLPGPAPARRPTTEEMSLIGMARWPDPTYNKEEYPSQQAYGRSFWKTTRDAGQQLAQGQIRSLRELWTYAQDWRGSTAQEQGAGKFGIGSQRPPGNVVPHMTKLNGRYAYVRDRYEQRSDGVLLQGRLSGKQYPIDDSIHGERIKLTSVVLDKRWGEAGFMARYKETRAVREESWDPADSELPTFRFQHTFPEDARRIMDHAETLFSRAMNPSISSSEALATLGELHWWVAQAMPDSRGSAAKAELCVRALAQARGMDLPPFARGVVPDLEAMTRRREDFVGSYAESFSRPPVPPALYAAAVETMHAGRVPAG